MTDALEEHAGRISIGNRMIINLPFADNTIGLACKKGELNSLMQCLDRTSTAYGMGINTEKFKLMANKSEGFKRDIKVKGQKLEVVDSFKYMGTIVTDEEFKPEVLSRIPAALAAMAKLRIIWRRKNLKSKVRLMCLLVASIFSI